MRTLIKRIVLTMTLLLLANSGFAQSPFTVFTWNGHTPGQLIFSTETEYQINGVTAAFFLHGSFNTHARFYLNGTLIYQTSPTVGSGLQWVYINGVDVQLLSGANNLWGEVIVEYNGSEVGVWGTLFFQRPWNPTLTMRPRTVFTQSQLPSIVARMDSLPYSILWDEILVQAGIPYNLLVKDRGLSDEDFKKTDNRAQYAKNCAFEALLRSSQQAKERQLLDMIYEWFSGRLAENLERLLELGRPEIETPFSKGNSITTVQAKLAFGVDYRRPRLSKERLQDSPCFG